MRKPFDRAVFQDNDCPSQPVRRELTKIKKQRREIAQTRREEWFTSIAIPNRSGTSKTTGKILTDYNIGTFFRMGKGL